MKNNKRAKRLTLGLVRSIYTQIIYLVLFEDSEPIKLWEYDKINDVGRNILSELIKGFDYGYEIQFQFPRDVNGERKLVPNEMVLINEPKEKAKEENPFNKKNSISRDKFYTPETEQEEILPDEKLLEFLKMYEEEKGL